jgi:hypothetical protein
MLYYRLGLDTRPPINLPLSHAHERPGVPCDARCIGVHVEPPSGTGHSFSPQQSPISCQMAEPEAHPDARCLGANAEATVSRSPTMARSRPSLVVHIGTTAVPSDPNSISCLHHVAFQSTTLPSTSRHHRREQPPLVIRCPRSIPHHEQFVSYSSLPRTSWDLP